MLLTDPVKRPSMEDILRHPWFIHALPPGKYEQAANILDRYEWAMNAVG
jgi:hypothetical protein